MHDPTTAKFAKIQQLMASGMMVGMDRPVGRVTWAKGSVQSVTASHSGVGSVRYLDKSATEAELPLVQTIDITRSIGQDAATCTMVFLNANPDSQQPEGLDVSGNVGYLTPGRGTRANDTTSSVYDKVDDFYGQATYPTGWGYSTNFYRDTLIPNTVLRTYQGYGSDNFDVRGNHVNSNDPAYVAPQDDTKLYMTGVWLIDTVTINTDGTISVECRDLAKLLIEQYIYPPMIPVDRFPLIYCPAHQATGSKEVIGKNVASFNSSSVDKKLGRNARVYGHRGTDAFDRKNGSFWLSGANASATGVEWLQAKTHGNVNEVQLKCYSGNYIAYICVHENGKWQGTSTISGTSENYEDLNAYDGNGVGGFFYVITHGDTLFDLAGKYYGDNQKWPIIARANSNIIKDPHWIYPGQKIKIPYVAGTKSPPSSGGGTGTESSSTSGYTGGTSIQLPYVIQTTIPKSGKVTVTLPRTYKADHVRVVFTSLNQMPNMDGYRVGVREMVVRNHIPDTFKASTIGKAGYIQDWTEPIKEMAAWAGLTWVAPQNVQPDPLFGRSKESATVLGLESQIKAITVDLAQRKFFAAGEKNKILARLTALRAQLVTAKAAHQTAPLRVFGDTEFLGAGPVVCTPGDYFMSKSFMDGIRQIVDFIGGIFYIDETGGCQFRLPNIWSDGNFLNDTSAASSLGARFSEHPIEFHEDANLTQYTMVISDEALRSEVLVIGGYVNVHATGPIAGGYVLGYNAATGTTSAIDFSNVLAGQYRLMILPGDSTKLFYTEEECQRMAELTALFILFTYRQGQLSSPCHPGLQIDDQVRIYERITNESYIHYVSSIDTHMDLTSGEYTMTCTTHWLGGDPDTNWFVDKAQLTPAVKNLPAIVKRVGRQAGGDNFEQPPYGT